MKQDNDHKLIKIHHFAALYKHSNVTFNIRMLERLKVRSNVEHSFMHYYKGQYVRKCIIYIYVTNFWKTVPNHTWNLGIYFCMYSETCLIRSLYNKVTCLNQPAKKSLDVSFTYKVTFLMQPPA